MRPDVDTYFMSMAILASKRATCIRRNVGCVLVNSRFHVIATGYNGVAAGQPHCNDREIVKVKVLSPLNPMLQVGYRTETHTPHACAGANAPSGQSLDACQAIHAEQNALLQCRDVYQIDTAYVTASPCVTCTKLLLNTTCKRIVFLDAYPQPAAKDLWEGAGRVWHQFTNTDALLLKM